MIDCRSVGKRVRGGAVAEVHKGQIRLVKPQSVFARNMELLQEKFHRDHERHQELLKAIESSLVNEPPAEAPMKRSPQALTGL